MPASVDQMVFDGNGWYGEATLQSVQFQTTPDPDHYMVRASGDGTVVRLYSPTPSLGAQFLEEDGADIIWGSEANLIPPGIYLDLEGDTVHLNSSLLVQANIQNEGEATIEQGFNIRVRVLDAVTKAVLAEYVDTVFDGLSGNSTYEYQKHIEFSDSTAWPEAVVIEVTADFGNAVQETSEKDNTAVSRTIFVGPEEAAPPERPKTTPPKRQ
jgi:hypothetical protein